MVRQCVCVWCRASPSRLILRREYSSGGSDTGATSSEPGNPGYALSRSTMCVSMMHWCSTGSPRSRLSIICAIFAPIASAG